VTLTDVHKPIGILCQQCQHLFDPHRVIATTGDPMEGGVMVCDVPECMCFSTWSVQNRPKPEVSPEEKAQWLAVKDMLIKKGEL
jgi:hypothetical protein